MKVNNLKELRIKANLSREDVANALGVTIYTVGHWETGRRKPRFDMIGKIAELYNTTTASIVGTDKKELNEQVKIDLVNEQTKIDLLDKVIEEFISEGTLNEDSLFDDLDDTNKQILIGALNKKVLRAIKTATEK